MSSREIATMRPATPRERALSLDVLRGFAIFGVLLSFIFWDSGLPETFSPLNKRLELLFECFVYSKFYTILSFLFGLGFFLQLDRAEDLGASVVATYCRRLAVLAVIGLLHGTFLRSGDILFPYAITGLLLLPFRNASNRMILAGALAMMLYWPLARAVWEATGIPIPQRPKTAGLGYFAHHWEWQRYWLSLGPLSWFGNLTTFLFGFYAGRNRLLARIAANPRAGGWIIGTGLAAGIALFFTREAFLKTFTFADASALQKFAAGLLFQGHAWALAACYITLILLLLRRDAVARRLQPLAATGRMALTNYLMQAMLVAPICVIFGLYDQMTPGLALGLALGLFLLVQLPFSVVWLHHFDYGPVEWLWRSLTYGKRQPMRRQAQLASA